MSTPSRLPAQREFFDDVPPDERLAGWDLLVPPERAARVFTTERVAKNAAKVEEIIRCVSSGQSISAAARAYGVSRNTVARLIMLRPALVDQLRKEAAAGFRVLSRMSVERLIESIDAIPLNVLPALAGIASDKAQALDGLATQIVEVKRGPADPARFDRWIDAQAEVVDVKEVPAGEAGVVVPSPSLSAAPAGSPPPLPDSQSGALTPDLMESESSSDRDAVDDALRPATPTALAATPTALAATPTALAAGKGGGGSRTSRAACAQMDSGKRFST